MGLPIWAWVLIVAAVVTGVLFAFSGRGDDRSGVSTEDYRRWRSECEARATAQLDRSLYEVGGNHWVDEVNDCLVEKAND